MNSVTALYRSEIIKRQAKELLETLGAGVLMGEPVNINDPDEMLVAAYFAGHLKGITETSGLYEKVIITRKP